MALKNTFGLTLELSAAEALARSEVGLLPSEKALLSLSAASQPVLPHTEHLLNFDFPEQELDLYSSSHNVPSSSNVPLHFRDSALLRSEQMATSTSTFSAEAAAAAYIPETTIYGTTEASIDDAPEEDDQNVDDEEDEEFIRLNYFVHNGYRYDGDIFELRPPQERSIASRPERVIEHKPPILSHRQAFNRVYSEGTYNNRPSSLRQLRLSARLSASSWASLSDMVAENAVIDANTRQEKRESLLVCTTIPLVDSNVLNVGDVASRRTSLLVENAASEMQKQANEGPTNEKPAPRLVEHISVQSENVDPYKEVPAVKVQGTRRGKKGRSKASGRKRGAKSDGRKASKAQPKGSAKDDTKRDAKSSKPQQKAKGTTAKRKPFWKFLRSSS